MAKSEVWKSLAGELGGEYSEPGLQLGFSPAVVRVLANVGDWKIELEAIRESSEYGTHQYTKFRAEYLCPKKFRCEISRLRTGPLWFLLNRGRIMLGSEDFDAAFRVKSNDEAIARALLDDQRIRQQIQGHLPDGLVSVRVKHLLSYMTSVSELAITQAGISEDREQLRSFIDLLLTLLERLHEMDLAEPFDDRPLDATQP